MCLTWVYRENDTTRVLMNTNVSRDGSYPLWSKDCRPCDGGCISGGRSSARCVEEDCSPTDRVPVPDHKRNSRQCAGEQIEFSILMLHQNSGEHWKCVYLCVFEADRHLTEGVQHEGPVLETATSERGRPGGRSRQSSVGLPLHSPTGGGRPCEAHSRLPR